ncbi:MAG: hypothetical protein CVU84_07050 [Firmicutes bacterium HGW-Firmicutes-1]|jgi:hypothetical protein|nr:MAG: hypothetical protein CVU84_07050 [Firmicutes bacterium HGW-Firmicutes-1]
MMKKNQSVQNCIYLGIPVLIIVGSLLHFVYEWSGNLTIVGLFAPTNESVWEHLKMTFWPMLIWWVVAYFVLSKSKIISATQWFVSCVVAILVCVLIIVSFFYTYTGAWGIESLILDIFSLFLGVAVGQILAFHVYLYANLKQICLYISIIILIFLAITFIVFTFAPPHIPLFMDSSTGKYGI